MPKKTTLADLREHMFATIEALSDPDNPMDVDRARAISDVGKRVIDSAKVEVDFLRTTGATHGSRFFELPEATEPKAVESKASQEQARRTKSLFPDGQ